MGLLSFSEGRSIILAEEVGRIGVDRDATGLEEFRLGPAAAEQADGAEPGLPGGLGIVGGIADDDRLRRIDLSQAVEGGLEDVGMGLGILRVVRRGLRIDEVFDPGDPLVIRQLLRLGR